MAATSRKVPLVARAHLHRVDGHVPAVVEVEDHDLQRSRALIAGIE
jgi:hypothetical protein